MITRTPTASAFADFVYRQQHGKSSGWGDTMVEEHQKAIGRISEESMRQYHAVAAQCKTDNQPPVHKWKILYEGRAMDAEKKVFECRFLTVKGSPLRCCPDLVLESDDDRKHLEYYFGLKGDRLESHRQVLAKHLALLLTQPATFDSPEEVPVAATHSEGSVRQVLVNAYERSSAARAACLAHYGYACCVCGFYFEKTYGSIGNDFIHVHHLKEIATIAEKYQVDPVKDLRPVCPNCHAMLHRKTPAYTIDELKRLILPPD